jgi:hypothetical protein
MSRIPNTGYLRFALEQDEDAVCVAVDDPGPPLRRVLDSFDGSLQRFSPLQATKAHGKGHGHGPHNLSKQLWYIMQCCESGMM